MRRAKFAMDPSATLALFDRAPFVHVCGMGADGQPVCRVVHGVLIDDRLCFHAAPVGEKLELLGQRVLASAQEVVAEIPSWSSDPERACPATTYYRSGQIHGRLALIEAEATRARVLARLMNRFQPEGRHVPLDPSAPAWPKLYRKAVAGLWIVEIVPERMSGKAKLGQQLRPAVFEKVLETLWERGHAGCDATIEALRHAHPQRPLPEFLRGPENFELCTRPTDEEALDLARVLCREYWHGEDNPHRVARAHCQSAAWIGARDASGHLIASARATTDGAIHALIHDVYVTPTLRGRGLGRALMTLLLDHPAVRACRGVQLVTRDAVAFYADLGFEARGDRYTRMLRAG